MTRPMIEKVVATGNLPEPEIHQGAVFTVLRRFRLDGKAYVRLQSATGSMLTAPEALFRQP